MLVTYFSNDLFLAYMRLLISLSVNCLINSPLGIPEHKGEMERQPADLRSDIMIDKLTHKVHSLHASP